MISVNLIELWGEPGMHALLKSVTKQGSRWVELEFKEIYKKHKISL